MRTTFFAIVIGLSLIAGTENLRAQSDEKLPVPEAPYIVSVPDYGHWKVTFKYVPDASNGAATAPPSAPGVPPAPSAPNGSIASIETIKTGDLRGVTVTLDNGTTKQFTCQGNWVLSSTAKGPQLGIANPASLPYGYYTTGFIMLDGVKIDLSTFKEAGKHDGTMAFHYKSGATDVWIDSFSMRPLGAKQNGVEVSYEFLTPPPRPFDIPKDQATLLQKQEEAYKATSNMR